MVKHSAYAVVGFGWVQETPGEFRRWLLRLCGGCNHIEVTPLIFIDAEFDICPNCLSQRVEALASNPKLNRCYDCNMTSEAGSMLDDEEDDDVLDDEPMDF